MLAWLPVIIASAAPFLCIAAYVIGRHRRQGVTIPWRPIFQLVDHRRRCLGQDRQRIVAELAAAVPIAPSAWEDLVPEQPHRGPA